MGDPAVTLGLLWRHATQPERLPPGRSGLTVDRIVEAAIGLADTGGLDALTMRSVAERLGVSAMTPYRYVPGKRELLDLMLDSVYAGMAVTLDPLAPWRDRVRAVAADNRTLQRAHPWTLRLSVARPPLGPGLLTKYDRELQAFDGIGLDDVEMDAALSHLLGFVRSTVLAEISAAEEAAESGTDDAGYWQAVEPVLAGLIDDRAFPLASRVGSASGAAHGTAYAPEHVYRFGLDRFLDGIAVLVAGRS